MTETVITITGTRVAGPELRFTPRRVTRRQLPRGQHPLQGRQDGGVEGRQHGLHDLRRVAPAGRECGREPAVRNPDDRLRPPAAAHLRHQGRREADRVRGPGRRDRSEPAQRHSDDREGHPPRAETHETAGGWAGEHQDNELPS